MALLHLGKTNGWQFVSMRRLWLGSSLLIPTDTCYKPIEFLTEEQRERKVEAFKRGYMTVGVSLLCL